MADSFDFFFSPTGPSWLPDRSPKGSRRGHDQEEDRRALPGDPRRAGDDPRRAGDDPRRAGDDPRRPPLRDDPRPMGDDPIRSSLPGDPGRAPDGPSRSPRSDDAAREPMDPAAVRRWALPSVSASAASFPKAPPWRDPEPDPEPELELDVWSDAANEHASVAPPVPPAPRLSTGQATALARDVAVPTLRAAVSRLVARGHEVSLRDALDSADPRLVVLFLPSEGPLRRVGAPEPSLAGFEIRIEGGRVAALRDGSAIIPDTGATPEGPHIVARHSAGPGSGGFLTLGRTPAAELAPEWITDRFVEFVQLTLERALNTT